MPGARAIATIMGMEMVWTYLLLAASAYAAGVINTLAGGGTLLTFPALASVVTLREANMTSTIALVSGSLTGAWGLRRDLAGTRPWLLLLAIPSLLGGLVGSLLLLYLDETFFSHIVPWLLLTASLLFLAQPYLARLVQRGNKVGDIPTPGMAALLCLFQLLVGIYGGYFGAGIGILMISSLSLMGLGDIHRVNAVKNLLAAGINGISIVVFVLSGLIVWRYALVMAVTATLGGLSGARLGRVLPRLLLRWLIILTGLTLAVYYFLKA